MSVGIMNRGHGVIFEKQQPMVDVNKEIVLVTKRVGDLYYVNELNQERPNIAETEVKSVLRKWH